MEIYTVFLKFQLFLFSLGEEGKPDCCFRGSINCFSRSCVMWGFDVIQCDGIGGGENVIATILFLLHAIIYNIPHTAVSLAGSRNKSVCPGTDKCGGGVGGGTAGGRAGVEDVSFYRCVTKEVVLRKG